MWLQSLLTNWLTAALCILPWFRHCECACRPTLGRLWSGRPLTSELCLSFSRLYFPICKVLFLWVCGWSKGAGPQGLGLLWEAGCRNHPFHFHWNVLLLPAAGESGTTASMLWPQWGTNTTFSPNLVLASSWEKEKWASCAAGVVLPAGKQCCCFSQ